MNVGFVQEFEYYFLNILLLEYNVLVENYARFPLHTILNLRLYQYLHFLFPR